MTILHVRAAVLLSSVIIVLAVTINRLGSVEAFENQISGQNKTRLQARILLETNNLDLDERRPVALDSELNSTSSSHQNERQRRKKSRAETPRGGLSNIWSMFLPSSSASSETSDYDESGEDSAEDGNKSLSSSSNSTVSSIVANLENDTSMLGKESESGRTVPKYSGPTKQEGTQSERLFASSSDQPGAKPSSSSLVAPSTLQTSSITTTESVDFLTGAVSKPDEGVNMNDIVANMMSSMSNRTGSNSAEREEVEVRKPSASISPVRAADKISPFSDENNGFERWLNRIQFQESPKQEPLTSTTKLPLGLQSSTNKINTTVSNPTRNNELPGANLRPSAPGQQSMGHPLKTIQQSVKGSQSKPVAAGNRRISQRQYPNLNSRFQHPFQQHRQQQQSQLIHGIKHPSAQASTIALSTQDGASNTSLSFGNNFAAPNPLNQLPPIHEVSQSAPVENATNHRNQDSSSTELQQQQQSGYQSQDEILRQVTSAINFEQQLNHKKREQDQRRNEPSSENLSNLPKASSGTNDTADTSKFGQSGEVEDIDKSFDMLAEKLRLLALQHQSSQLAANSSQPTWLRRPSLHESSSLLATGTGSGNSSKNIDQLLELLSQHERNKNELKASQDSMVQLMQQLSKLGGTTPKQPSQHQATSDKQPSNQAVRGEVSNDFVYQTPKQDQVEPWTPVNVVSNEDRLPPSPANMAKHRHQLRLKESQPLVISQMKDNVGYGNDFANDDYYLNNLSMMFASSPNNAALSQEKIFGLPIAVLKDDEQEQSSVELAPGQLEAAALAAAEQLIGHNQQNPHKLASAGTMDRSQLRNQNQLSQLTKPVSDSPSSRRGHQPLQPAGEPLGQIQKLLQHYSPQTFTQGLNSGPSHPFHQAPPDQANVASLPVVDPSQRLPITMGGSGDVASLIHEQVPLSEHDMHKNIVDSTSHLIGDTDLRSSYHRHPLSERPGMDGRDYQHKQHSGQSLGGRFSQDLQRAQQQQNIQSNPNNVQLQQHQNQQLNAQTSRQHDRPRQHLLQQVQGYVEYPQIPPSIIGDFNAGLYPGNNPAQMTTTTVNNPGLPIRIREINLPRPFGFRSHHSIAYTPSPAISALRAGLAQSASRPSLLRHMSPLRASLSHGQRLLAPLIQLPQVPPDHLHYSPYSPLVAQQYLNNPYRMRQFRRQSNHPGPLRMQNKSTTLPSSNSISAASQMKAKHVELTEDIDRPDQYLVDYSVNQLDGSFDGEFMDHPVIGESDLWQKHVELRKTIREPSGLRAKQQMAKRINPKPTSASSLQLRGLQRGRHMDLPQIQIDRPSLPKIKPTCEPHSTTSTASIGAMNLRNITEPSLVANATNSPPKELIMAQLDSINSNYTTSTTLPPTTISQQPRTNQSERTSTPTSIVSNM